MKLKNITYILFFSILFISCKSSNDIDWVIEHLDNNEHFIANIDLDLSVNDEMDILDYNNQSDATRSIKLSREGNKFVSRFIGAAGEKIPVFIELRSQFGYGYANAEGFITSDKNLKIKGDVDFTVLNENKRHNSNQIRIVIGAKTVIENNNVIKVKVEESLNMILANGEWTNFDSYKGKIPFLSPFEEIDITQNGSNLSISFKDKNKITSLKPTGNILRLRFYNPEANPTVKSQNISRVIFESNTLVSKGEIQLGNDGHNWRSLTFGGSQVVEYRITEAHRYIPVQPQQYADIYMWVDYAFQNDSNTTIKIDYTKDHLQGNDYVLLNKSETPNIEQGKSSIIWLTLPQ